jgi:hypothetical protein
MKITYLNLLIFIFFSFTFGYLEPLKIIFLNFEFYFLQYIFSKRKT